MPGPSWRLKTNFYLWLIDFKQIKIPISLKIFILAETNSFNQRIHIINNLIFTNAQWNKIIRGFNVIQLYYHQWRDVPVWLSTRASFCFPGDISSDGCTSLVTSWSQTYWLCKTKSIQLCYDIFKMTKKVQVITCLFSLTYGTSQYSIKNQIQIDRMSH